MAINIRAGGNATTTGALVARILRHDADVVVCSEFRDNAAGSVLRAALTRAGYAHHAFGHGQRANGVLIAATEALAAVENPFGLPADEYPNAVLQVRLAGFVLLGVYLPGQSRKRPHLRCLVAFAQYCNDNAIDALCIGDVNSGRNATDIEVNVRSGAPIDAFDTADLYEELERHWTEAWALLHPDEFEFSWYPFRLDPDFVSRNGWRVDKALLSASLAPRLRAAEYDHLFRLDHLTDHSAIVVDLA